MSLVALTADELRDELHKAVRAGDVARVDELARAGADVNRIDAFGCVPIWIAAQYGPHTMVETLARLGADGISPLASAAANGDPATVETLVRFGADVNAVLYDGWTPLHVAALHGHASTVEMLVSLRANRAAASLDGKIAADLALDPHSQRLLALSDAEVAALVSRQDAKFRAIRECEAARAVVAALHKDRTSLVSLLPADITALITALFVLPRVADMPAFDAAR